MGLCEFLGDLLCWMPRGAVIGGKGAGCSTPRNPASTRGPHLGASCADVERNADVAHAPRNSCVDSRTDNRNPIHATNHKRTAEYSFGGPKPAEPYSAQPLSWRAPSTHTKKGGRIRSSTPALFAETSSGRAAGGLRLRARRPTPRRLLPLGAGVRSFHFTPWVYADPTTEGRGD